MVSWSSNLISSCVAAVAQNPQLLATFKTFSIFLLSELWKNGGRGEGFNAWIIGCLNKFVLWRKMVLNQDDIQEAVYDFRDIVIKITKGACSVVTGVILYIFSLICIAKLFVMGVFAWASSCAAQLLFNYEPDVKFLVHFSKDDIKLARYTLTDVTTN